MIHVDRENVAAPGILASKAADEAKAAAAAFFRLGTKARAQRAFDFDPGIYAAEEVRTALHELFRGKCAYCESQLVHADLVVDHFRPRSGALDLDGTISFEHYWWLSYEWTNLYASCTECSSQKGPRFPVGSRRSRARARGKALLSERMLLLDPCADNPEEDLVFLEDGRVAGSSTRGGVTIDVLGLNRSRLIDARAQAFGDVKREWTALLERLKSTASFEELEALFDASLPFAALRRQFVKEWAFYERGAVDELLAQTPEAPDSIVQVATEVPVVTETTKSEALTGLEARQVAQEAYSVAGEPAGEDYFIRARMIERIVIRNFKVIKDLTLKFPPAPPPQPDKPPPASWLMLLGENGYGKSSILQAVALALVGQEYRDRLGVDASAYLRHRTREGGVEVHLAGSPEPITLTFGRGSDRFGGTPQEPKVLLLGYGATRLLPRGDARSQTEVSFARVDNLFNPFIPLADVTTWLLGLDPATFDSVARALKGLFPLEDEAQLIRNTRQRRIDVDTLGARVPLEHVSDGYQSVIALAADVMIVLRSHWLAMEAAEGIVLVDELGAHLHPRWRMRIVKSLRNVFPRVQFLVSTHDPLCLRGLENGEVAVMRRVDKEIVALTDLPPVAGLRVDQLLTSEHFGLYNTIEPQLDSLFAEYYLLKAKAHLTEPEQKRHDDLRDQLDDLRELGTTQRDRLVLAAADDFLARERDVIDNVDRLQLKDETKQRIARIWERVAEGEVQ